MEIRLLAKGYKTNEAFYQDFLDDKINSNDEYFSGEKVYISQAPDFPVYMAKGTEEQKKQDFLEAFRVISQSYLQTKRELLLDETFWHSLLVTQKREYILDKYPEVQEGKNKFNTVVLKKFDWENYIYKSILGAQYINDNIGGGEERQRYYELIIENLDLYNYIIKYGIFRNDIFLIHILDIIDELELSKVMKAKIKGREDLGDDERYGRRVIFEFNKSYPVVMSPMLEKEELKKLFIMYLGYYYDLSKLPSVEKYDSAKQDPEQYEAVAETAAANVYTSQQNENKEDVYVPESQSSVQVKEKNEKVLTPNQDETLVYLESQNLEYVDYRSKGGSLWVIGNQGIETHLEPLKEKGVHFRFKPRGGRASKKRPAWFWNGK
ncbi:hypothetical protein [Oceanobacillus sp. FSL H7-0719]|uniref:hypothetical protein n=1 Tax=Oceanobacillus sp. FSL H7-0719 TaxID=2954507 RepID=UPI00324B6609